jgi:hypothetical protein
MTELQSESTKTIKKVTRPRKPRAKASFSEVSTSNKSTSEKSKPFFIEETKTSSSRTTTSSKSITQKEKTVEKVYQKKTQHEHILLRPDVYVGSVESLKEKCGFTTLKNKEPIGMISCKSCIIFKLRNLIFSPQGHYFRAGLI